MLTLADDLKTRGAALRVLNLGGANVDTSTPTDPWSSWSWHSESSDSPVQREHHRLVGVPLGASYHEALLV